MAIHDDMANEIVEGAANAIITGIGASVEKILNLNNNDNNSDIEEIEEEEKEKYQQNAILARQELIDRYGIRQEVIIANKNVDTLLKAQRIFHENAKEKEDIEVEVIGDLDYRVGWGVHVKVDWLPTGYQDCFMYIKDVKHTWKNDNTFVSTLTLTPSRVMDTKEWSDTSNDDEDESNGNCGKVIESAVNWAMAICADDSHGYSQSNRWGPDYDCSSFTISAFEQAGVQLKENGASYTGNMKQACLKCGFEVVDGWDRTTTAGLEKGDILLNEANHVCLYIGGGKVANASSDRGHPETGDQDSTEIYITDFYVYPHGGWDCALRYIEPDTGDGDDYSSVGIPDEYLSIIQSSVESNVSTFIRNLDNYGYKNNLITICKQNNIEPYTMAGIICIESEGNPVCGTGKYKGLCQVENGSSDPANNIKKGCQMYNEKCSATGYSSVWVSLSAYNSGEGTVINACKSTGLDMKTCTVKQLGDALYSYVSSHNPSWSPTEKKYYASKCLLAMRILKSKNVLG